MMCMPRQRGAYVSTKCKPDLTTPDNPVIDYCAHCLNGGTVATVKNNLPSSGWYEYDPISNFQKSANRAGLCGDPKGKSDHMLGGSFMPYSNVPIVATYKAGSTVNFQVEIDTNHNGYFEFYLCNIDHCGTNDISQKCFNEGKCYRLDRVPHPSCQSKHIDSKFECGPIDKKYPGRFYVPCRKTGHVGEHIVGGKSGTMRYKLPEGVTCNHCVVQWYWATANSCAPPNFLEYFETYNDPFGSTCDGDGGAKGAYREGMTTCGGTQVPEEFWSCADVRITADGRSKPSNSSGEDASDGENENEETDLGDNSDETDEEEEAVPPPASTSSPTSSPTPSQTSSDNYENENINQNSENNEESDEDDNDDDSDDSEDQEESEVGGNCTPGGKQCSKSRLCCGIYDVCVYRSMKNAFLCQKWWTLYDEVNDRADWA